MEAHYRTLADLFAAGMPLIAPPGPALPDSEATERPPATPQAPSPAAARATPVAEPLSARERQVLELSARGLRDREIAEQLFIGPKTVETHAREALRKLGARTRAEAVYRALQQGLLPLHPADDEDTGPTRPPPQRPPRR
jgi:DNA-binding NarL/FixJ family response regulator